MARSEESNTLARLFDVLGDDAAAAREWVTEPHRLIASNERLGTAPEAPADDDPEAIRTVGVIGGGTAGYLTALALKAKRPWLDVALVESADIPIIGVGEATVSYMVMFLHHYLGIDPAEFYQHVRPTWKLGIRFEWGSRPEGFVAPFDWGTGSVGLVGSLRETGNVNEATLQAMLMTEDRVPVYRGEGGHVSLMKYLPFAYHMDNARLVRYLTELATRRGVHHVDATVAEVRLDGPDHVGDLITTDGRRLHYDFYVDCTGFRSLLLEKALGIPFESYASSLFTDAAITGTLAHGGHLKPYTTATTMNAGWCWTIPTPESDHLGYVFSSAAIDPDDAAAEMARRFPGVTREALVRFRSGRHREAWRGNVIAVGNSYAFVEPLESSGLLMIATAVQILVSLLPSSRRDPLPSNVANQALAHRWDAIRWFLSIHYRFNGRLDTPFWKEARAETDISGIEPLLRLFSAGAPLTGRDSFARYLADGAAPLFYGLEGVDTLLLGQEVPARLLPPRESPEQWRARAAAARSLASRGLRQSEALDAYAADPCLNAELLSDSDSWAGERVAVRAGLR
uniref:Tryptophan-5-halogenase n=1 Tax=Microbispora corallina TaxID=83302 RepID=E2IHC5_9ACTN|nr:tryptophan-5-halogenase [Microbispora corallina]